MTPTNSQIMQALFSRLTEAELDYTIAWPGLNFTPPDSGIWLEVIFQPNTGIDNGLAADDGVVPRGLLTIMVMTRPGSGIVGVQQAADSVMAAYPKNATLVGLVRVSRAPQVFDLNMQDDRLGVAVSVEYSG